MFSLKSRHENGGKDYIYNAPSSGTHGCQPYCIHIVSWNLNAWNMLLLLQIMKHESFITLRCFVEYKIKIKNIESSELIRAVPTSIYLSMERTSLWIRDRV